MDRTNNTSDTSIPPSIPFSFFVSLLSEISQIRPKTRTAQTVSNTYPALVILQRWIAELHRKFGANLSSETTLVVFRLLFPEEDVRRKYDMKESRLAQHITTALGVSNDSGARGAGLQNWSTNNTTGCLGEEVLKVMKASATKHDFIGTMSIHDVDSLLDQLASLSAFSHESVRKNIKSSSDPPRTKAGILRTLYSAMSALDASFLTQIILKDLRPLLYPSPATHYTAALKQFNSNSTTLLTVHDALRAWDSSLGLLNRWRTMSRFEEALLSDEETKVRIFAPLQIPKTIKGTGCAKSLQLFQKSNYVWAETKYDGERAQIHVKVDPSTGSVDIRIFSKSKRDSTQDRAGVHSTVLNALSLSGTDRCRKDGMRSIKHDIIVEAEMVAFSDALGQVDEFWRIRSLIEATAEGPRAKWSTRRKRAATAVESQCSMLSDASDGGHRHLALVFFDVLFLDSESLTSTPYFERRKILESVVLPIPGYSMLAERTPINLQKGPEVAQSELRAVLARVLADHQEGVILKADNGFYIRSPWVKLKKDYIPSLGDCLDVVIVGARWDKERGRELRVPPGTYTTFYLALLSNEEAIQEDSKKTPHFETFFSVSYGLSRDQLEDLNFMIKSSDLIAYTAVCQNPNQLGYTYSMFGGMPTPEVMLKKDELILTEVFGAGFTKAPQSKYYELRFPRMTKVFRRPERSWREGSSLKEFQRLARQGVGRERLGKEVDDWCKGLWGKPISPSVKHPLKRRQREDTLIAELERVDEKRMKVVNDEEDSEFFTSNKNGAVSTCRPVLIRGLRALESVTNIASTSKLVPDLVKENEATPTAVHCEPISPPLTTPTRKRWGTFMGPAPATVTNPEHSPPPSGHSPPVPWPAKSPNLSLLRDESTFIDLTKEKRKRSESDVGPASSRKKSTFNYRLTPSLSVTDSKTPDAAEILRKDTVITLLPSPVSSAAKPRVQSVSRTLKPSPKKVEKARTVGARAGAVLPWGLPPPPPPSASGWHPYRKNGTTSMSNISDQIASYCGAGGFYTKPPSWKSSPSPTSGNTEAVPDLLTPRPTVYVLSRSLSAPIRFNISKILPDSSTPKSTAVLFKHENLLFAETAVGKLLKSSIVYFARDLDTPAPSYRPTWGQIIPQTNKVTRMEALLTGCGWHMNTHYTTKQGVDQGIVVVDFEEQGEISGHVKMADVVRKCEDSWGQVRRWKGGEASNGETKPVWVVDARILRWDLIESVEDVEKFVKWRKG